VLVPLLFHDPSGTLFQPRRLRGPASELDIMPTVLPLLGFKVTGGTMHGMSLFELPRDRVLMMSCYGMCAMRITATEAFIHHFNRRPDELFALDKDPRELNDLAPRYPQLLPERRNELLAFLRRRNEPGRRAAAATEC
jgi:arylsulfatase A-like enzyme